MITIAEINIPVSQCSEGLYLRWCFGGWHYQMFKVGDEIYATSGAVHNTDSKSQLKIGISGLSYQGMRGLRTMLFATAVEAYFPDGWKPITFENSTTTVEDTSLSTYSCEYTITVYARNGLYSPVKPVVTDDYIVSYAAFPDITTTVGGTVTLPATASVVYFSGRTATVNVTWGSYSTSEAGTFTIVGIIVGSTFTVEQKLIVNELSDLDILRQIRDANPTSQLNTLFDDSKNPHSEWWNGYNGAVFGDSPYFNSAFESIGATPIPVNDRIANRCYIFAWWDALDLRYVPNLNNLTKLIYLNLNYNLIENINITGLINLEYLDLYYNKIGSINLLNCTKLKKLWLSECGLNNIDVTGLQELELFNVDRNLLSSIISLTSKGGIITYDFRYNNFPTSELDRFRSLGFTDESKLLPQNP